MTSDNANRRLVVVIAVASFLMLIFGLTYRVLVAQLTVPVNKAPIDAAALEQFPLQIGGWTGQDVSLDEALVDRTGTDAYITRQYSRSGGLESISLYVACGVKAIGHHPPVCYIEAGLSLIDRCSMDLLLDDGTKLPCSIFQFFQGELDTKKVTVLYYLISDGQYFSDVTLSLLQAWQRLRAVGYVAQVQIISSTESLSTDSAMRLVSDFAVDSASSIALLFESLEEERSSDEFLESLKGK